jgi:hypothetical protein
MIISRITFLSDRREKVRTSKDESRRLAATSWTSVLVIIRVLLDSPISMIIVLSTILASSSYNLA